MSGARPPPRGRKRGNTEVVSCINAFQENRSKGHVLNMANTTNQVQPPQKSSEHLFYFDIWHVKSLDVFLVCQSMQYQMKVEYGREKSRKLCPNRQCFHCLSTDSPAKVCDI